MLNITDKALTNIADKVASDFQIMLGTNTIPILLQGIDDESESENENESKVDDDYSENEDKKGKSEQETVKRKKIQKNNEKQ